MKKLLTHKACMAGAIKCGLLALISLLMLGCVAETNSEPPISASSNPVSSSQANSSQAASFSSQPSSASRSSVASASSLNSSSLNSTSSSPAISSAPTVNYGPAPIAPSECVDAL